MGGREADQISPVTPGQVGPQPIDDWADPAVAVDGVIVEPGGKGRVFSL